MGTILFFAAVLTLLLAAYYLFFAPVPLIETVTRPSNIEMISGVTAKDAQSSDKLLDEIQNSALFNSFRSYVPNPEIGALGRPNPFAQF